MIEYNIISSNLYEDMIFPVTVYLRQGNYTVDVYEDVLDTVKSAEEKFNGELLSSDALSYIENALIEYYKDSDYEKYTDDGGLFRLFTADSTTVFPVTECDVKDLCDGCDGSLLDTIDLEEAIYFNEKGSVIEIGGKVVCACVENFPDEDNCEVAVETAVGYRQKGYAKACLVSMAKKITENGRLLTYLCSADNIESVKTAQSAGLSEIGRDYYFIFAKRED